MNTAFFQEKVLPFIYLHKISVVLTIFGMIFFVYGLIHLFVPKENEIVITQPSQMATQAPEKIVVDIQGAVVKPGIYTITKNQRIHDVLIRAGGLSDSANREWVSKYLNLASKLSDGAKLYVPFKGEEMPVSVKNTSTQDIGSLVSINSASISQLDELPGIGKVTAQKIIDKRPFTSLEELISKKAVSKSVYEKIKNSIQL